MPEVGRSPPTLEASQGARPAPNRLLAVDDPTADWPEARREVLGVLRGRPRGTPEVAVRALTGLPERRVSQELETLADMGFARCASEMVLWGRDLVEVLLWHIDLSEACVKALAFLPRRRRSAPSCPTKVPAEFWMMFWSGARGSDAVLPRDSFDVACTLLDCPDRAAQAWALCRLPVETLERCRRMRGFDVGEIAAALDAAIAARQGSGHG